MATDSYTYASTRDDLAAIAAATGTYEIRCVLLAGYIYDEDHEYADDLTGELTGGGYARVVTSGFARTVTDGESVYTLDDTTFASLTATGVTHAALIQWKGSNATSPIVACLKFPSTNVTAEDFVIAWPDRFVVVGDGRDQITSVAGVPADSTGDVPVADLADAITVEIAGGTIPDPADGTAGQVWTIDDDGAAASWADGFGGLDIMPILCPCDADYGDPADTAVALTEDAYAYFFTSNPVDGDWVYAGIYQGTSPDTMTPANPVRIAEHLQPVPGRTYHTRGVQNFQATPIPEWDTDHDRYRSVYISPNNGVNMPVQVIHMEYPNESWPGTTDENFPILGAKYTGNLSTLTDTSTLEDALDVVDAMSGGSGSVATDAIFDAKGDLAVGTGSNTAAKLTVGANDTILMAASGEATGQKWATPTEVLTALALDAQSWNPRPKLKTTGTGRTSTTTVSADPDLVTGSLPANSVWTVRWDLIVGGGSTPDFKATVVVPTGSTLNVMVMGTATAATTGYSAQTNITSSGTEVACGLQAGTTNENFISLIGYVSIGSTAGAIELHWAQNTSDGATVTVGDGSQFHYRRVS